MKTQFGDVSYRSVTHTIHFKQNL